MSSLTGERLKKEQDAFTTHLRGALRHVGDPERALRDQRYLKSVMPVYGVGVPQTRRVTTQTAKDHQALWHDPVTWEKTLRHLWDEATHREERWAVLHIIRSNLSRAQASRLEALELYEHLLRTGAWWDLVDDTSHAVGMVLLSHPQAAGTIRGWSTDPDLWVRRSSIICQLQHKDRTDQALLTDAIEANQDDDEFFIRKAIGWALRDYARTDAGWVLAFVQAHPRLSPLSRREALKHL